MHARSKQEGFAHLERFSPWLKNIECTNTTMTLKFYRDDDFAYAQKHWDWVNEAKNHSFVMIVGKRDCGWNPHRMPFRVHMLKYEDYRNTAILTGVRQTFETVTDSFEFNFGIGDEEFEPPPSITGPPSFDISAVSKSQDMAISQTPETHFEDTLGKRNFFDGIDGDFKQRMEEVTCRFASVATRVASGATSFAVSAAKTILYDVRGAASKGITLDRKIFQRICYPLGHTRNLRTCVKFDIQSSGSLGVRLNLLKKLKGLDDWGTITIKPRNLKFTIWTTVEIHEPKKGGINELHTALPILTVPLGIPFRIPEFFELGPLYKLRLQIDLVNAKKHAKIPIGVTYTLQKGSYATIDFFSGKTLDHNRWKWIPDYHPPVSRWQQFEVDASISMVNSIVLSAIIRGGKLSIFAMPTMAIPLLMASFKEGASAGIHLHAPEVDARIRQFKGKALKTLI